jgi:hypothetical protein
MKENLKNQEEKSMITAEGTCYLCGKYFKIETNSVDYFISRFSKSRGGSCFKCSKLKKHKDLINAERREFKKTKKLKTTERR